MDEVRTDRLLAKHGKDTILILIRDWPNSEKYKGKPELVVSLEYLVSMLRHLDLHSSFKTLCILYLDVRFKTLLMVAMK